MRQRLIRLTRPCVQIVSVGWLAVACSTVVEAAARPAPTARPIPEGLSIAVAGDVDRDGYADVLVGESKTGRAFLFCGSATGPLRYPSWAVAGQSNAAFGALVAPAGDVNNDGFADVIVTAPGLEGTVYVYHGSSLGLSVTPDWSARGAIAAGAGDINGDGFADIIIGEPAAGVAGSGLGKQGRVAAYFGSRRGLSAKPAWTTERDPASVAALRKVDRPRFDDPNLSPFANVILAYFDLTAPNAAPQRPVTSSKAPVWQRWWFAVGLIGMTGILVHFIARSRITQPPLPQLPAESCLPDQILDAQHALLIESVARSVEAIKANRDQPLCR
jgi:VCBS repeat protein/FG-GAP repeat protein